MTLRAISSALESVGNKQCSPCFRYKPRLAGEVITGDLATPIKHFNPQVRGAFEQMEQMARNKLLTMLPHEVLHAACFVEDVYLYTNLKQGMLFVTGPEDMSRGRFVGMSLLPNLVFGIVPYAIGFALRLPTLGYFGAFCISMGAGDYYNIFNALTQMPRGARTYIDGFRSYWYLP